MSLHHRNDQATCDQDTHCVLNGLAQELSWIQSLSEVNHGLLYLHVVASKQGKLAGSCRLFSFAQDPSVALERAVECQVGLQPDPLAHLLMWHARAPQHQPRPMLLASSMVSEMPPMLEHHLRKEKSILYV